jgi:hypothetical protein
MLTAPALQPSAWTPTASIQMDWSSHSTRYSTYQVSVTTVACPSGSSAALWPSFISLSWWFHSPKAAITWPSLVKAAFVFEKEMGCCTLIVQQHMTRVRTSRVFPTRVQFLKELSPCLHHHQCHRLQLIKVNLAEFWAYIPSSMVQHPHPSMTSQPCQHLSSRKLWSSF